MKVAADRTISAMIPPRNGPPRCTELEAYHMKRILTPALLAASIVVASAAIVVAEAADRQPRSRGRRGGQGS